MERNSARSDRLKEEMDHLQELPQSRLTGCYCAMVESRKGEYDFC